MTRIGLFFLALLRHLPRRWLATLGERLGLLLYRFGRGRVTDINLALCFPTMPEALRRDLARRTFRNVGRGALELSILWFAPKEEAMAMVKLVGAEHLEKLAGQPVIILAPHFVGLDFGGARVGHQFKVCSMYSQQKNPVMNQVMLDSRMRFGPPVLVARQEGLRPLVKHIKAGLPFYYLPDMDFGAKDALFVPFFGQPAATVTALSRLTRLTGAKVVMCVTRQLSPEEGYETRLYPPWENFPGESVEEDTARMNREIEARVLEVPDQYFWVHKRFKTQADGSSPY